jgi:microcystin-dependent protein
VTAAQSAQTAAENAESRASTSASAAEGSASSASAAQTAAESAQTSASQAATIATQAQQAAAQSAQAAQAAQAAAESVALPVGSYIYFAGSSVPAHYLLCNGAAVSRTDYADLYAVIGDTYGAGDGSTTFNLPNLIDKFLEGSSTAGTEISAGLPNITGGMNVIHWNTATSSGCIDETKGNTTINNATGATFGNNYWAVTLDASRSSAIYGNSSTVQPPALTALPCIRYE